MPSPALLAIDWGTSALRGALLAEDGRVLAEHAAPRGLLSIAPGGWAQAFEEEFGAWRQAHPGLRCLLAGMVGSRQGWAEAAYCACPAGLPELAGALLWLQPGQIAIVPGLSCQHDSQQGGQHGGLPDVMRGEETQVLGALHLLGLQDADQVALVLPGTHSKWVRVQRGRISSFATHMTGECYALLRQQSILARTLPADDSAWVADAFDQGVAQAQRPGGLLHHLFAVRALALFDRQDGPWLASYLSGLLIGEELRAQALPAGLPVVVVGSAALIARYQQALAPLGLPLQTVGSEATWRGLSLLAAQR